ncbi:phosphate ABC transporter permease subunit PstC [Magnetospira thiophila]
MQTFLLLLAVVSLVIIGYKLGHRRSIAMAGGKASRLHSLPGYHGLYVALWCFGPAILVMMAWLIFEPIIVDTMVMDSLPQSAVADKSPAEMRLMLNDIRNIAAGNIASQRSEAKIIAAAQYSDLKQTSLIARIIVVMALAFIGLWFGWRAISVEHRARNLVERTIKALMIVCSTIAIFTTVGIILSLLFESARFFEHVPIMDFLFGLEWSPQMAIRADQVGSSGAFGAVPLLAGTFLISIIALLVAVPIGLLTAIYMAEYASMGLRNWVKPIVEILAGIPTVVYGFFAALTVAPFFRNSGELFGLTISSESALAAGGVMGIMLIPFVSSLSDDVINAVPQSLRDGSYGLGATKSETIRRVILPAALPGIVGSILLAASRAIGETMIVVMAAGLAANLTANPFQAVTTVTVQIVTLLVGDQEFDSPKTLAAFALGLVLFCITLILNIIALQVVRKYREAYD